MARSAVNPREAAETLAVQALSFVAADTERLGRFLALTGIGPQEMRRAAREQGFLAGVLAHLMEDEALLAAFAAEARIEPRLIAHAHRILGGAPWEREVP